MAATSRGGWFVGAKALQGNPYDGHKLMGAIAQVERITRRSEHLVDVDIGYRGHGYTGKVDVPVDNPRPDRTAKSLWRWMKRRAAVEPGNDHLKQEHRMDRKRLKGAVGDRINGILSAAGSDFHKLVRLAVNFLRQIFFCQQIYQRAWA